MPKTVGVVGMGYVGLTLTAALARKGYVVHGVDVSPRVVEALSNGRIHVFEPGVEETFAEFLDRSVFISDRLPAEPLDAAILSVSTPVDLSTGEPDLRNLRAAAEHVAERPSTLVVVRSTVPIGASRAIVLPALTARWSRARLVMAPERTIQGQALRELVELPQVIGGLDDDSLRAGIELFDGLVEQIVPVSGLETAEMVKLSNNCHTDLIYAFGNELALIAEQHGLDPLEVIRATNLDYPRPDLAKPGYVGGGCLSKDPYIMLSSTGPERRPYLVGQARALNERLPVHVAERVVELVRQTFGHADGVRLSVLGWAYKGWPATDDMRGTPIADMMPVFRAAGLVVKGHDPLVSDDVIREYGGEPVSLDKAFADADAMIVVNDHPDYRGIEVEARMATCGVRVLFDSWRILDEAAVTRHGVRYAGIGYLAERSGA
ncbi:nucleotide sugar dehydrogenase [Nonomuraea jiangxiensis]|uniref:UDP-N-acetyl-D-mannosaminuronic acid dehydrogenase n=1 Tax=Nonomuraea jiangxiensis TaxID=633440 RepID=A0A1G8MEW0_9ACTN|nr:nucleotide sugar dehydrogenase [Nonomuraea jiangxiensis]SDI65880.1 UDP-N-acetyl-D-mannosaminuronic acid dehydrogenase [Nonomuraea jiangxiensis]